MNITRHCVIRLCFIMIDKTNRETALVYLILFQYISLSGHCTMGLCSSFCTVSIKQGFLGYETWDFFLYPVSLTLSLRRRKSIICQHKSDLNHAIHSVRTLLELTHLEFWFWVKKHWENPSFPILCFLFFPKDIIHCYICVYINIWRILCWGERPALKLL